MKSLFKNQYICAHLFYFTYFCIEMYLQTDNTMDAGLPAAATGAAVSKFETCAGECMAVAVPANLSSDFPSQLSAVSKEVDRLEREYGPIVFARLFLSDPANQEQAAIECIGPERPFSIIGQAPLCGAKVAVWLWMRKDALVSRCREGMFHAVMPEHEEFWSVSRESCRSGSKEQTMELLENFASALSGYGLSMERDCVRTWFFARDIDNSYSGLVEGRNKIFDRYGLTDDNHYIASTGIAGQGSLPDRLVKMDAVAARGICRTTYLYAERHLNRTSQYGVRFERGTAVDFSDRRHVFISGTASIDNRGQVVFPGNVIRQTGRMLENVEALLAEAGCGFGNVAVMLVYLRDIADYAVVDELFRKRFPATPFVILHAAVCRPAWLIEMECIALK